LDKVADILKQDQSLHLQIDGYASKEGDRFVNLGVSNARANAVHDYLVSKGIDKSRLKVAYYGADKLLTGEDGKQAVNRRVELKLH
jgi:outer membrane protein OmpA-like peptidoglycan-associated protein